MAIWGMPSISQVNQTISRVSLFLYLQYLGPPTKDMAVVVKTLMGSHFWAGAPLILVYFCRDWDVHWGYRCLTHGHMGDALNIASKPNHFQGFPFSLLAIFRSTDQRYGCGCQNPDGIPFLGGCTTDFSLFLSGLGCSLGVQVFDPWPYGGCPQYRK